MLFGRVSRKMILARSFKNNLQNIQLSDTTGTANGTGFYGQMKLKDELLAANTQDNKKYPMCTMKYTDVYLMLWDYISAGGPGRLV